MWIMKIITVIKQLNFGLTYYTGLLYVWLINIVIFSYYEIESNGTTINNMRACFSVCSEFYMVNLGPSSLASTICTYQLSKHIEVLKNLLISIR